MTSPGSSIISALGAGSGIDFTRLADDLSGATFSAQRENLTTRKSLLEARISAASALRNSLNSLVSALGDRIRSGDLAPRARLGNPNVASVSIAAGVNPQGSYSLEVTQLAGAQKLVSSPFPSASDTVGEGTLRIRFGAVDGAGFTANPDRAPVEITVTAGETLAELASRITSATGREVTAQVLAGTNGAQLVLKGLDGEANGFVIEVDSLVPPALANPGDLAFLAWNPATDAGQLRRSASDALFTLDTVEMRSSSNIATGLPEGMILQLTATNIGAPTSITFSNDPTAIRALMGDFTSALNEIIAGLNEVGNPLGGELGNDPGVRALRRALGELSSQVVMPNAAPGDPRTLADLGLSINRDGTFRLDNSRLNETIANAPRGAAAMFTTGLLGVFSTMDRLARNTTRLGDPGTLGGSMQRYQRQLQSNDERLGRIADQQDRLRERLTRDFTAAQTRISGSQSTLTFLRQQIDIWSAPRR